MRLTLAHAVLLIAVLAGPFGLGAPARADWKILYYDSNGRLIELDQGTEPQDESGPVRPQEGSSSTPPPAARPDAAGSPLDAQSRYVPGELIVANPPRNFEIEARALGFTVIERISLHAVDSEVYRLKVPAGLTVPGALARLIRLFPGLAADANHLVDPLEGLPTAEGRARGIIGWHAVTADCGRGVLLGTIDGAVDIDHPGLVGQDIEYRSFHAANRRPGAIEHGTAIAAMLVGNASWGGLLPAAQLKAANIFEIDESGQIVANVFALLKAVGWLIEERVHVINLSVAGSDNKVLSKILGRARAMGAVMVAAAGNGGRTAPPAYPAAYEDVIAVTAVDAGKHIYPYANRGRYIDFAAPGVEIWTAVPGGGRAQSGTSFAVPYVTVLAALEVAGGTARGTTATRERLRTQIVDLGAPGRDEEFGWGLVSLPRNCAAQAQR